MKSLYHAYETYERRVIRGEFFIPRKMSPRISPTLEPLTERLGDLLIQTGMKLKTRRAARKPMTWSLSMGGKP